MSRGLIGGEQSAYYWLAQAHRFYRAIMNAQRPAYWFKAKRYGWGWGLPLTWQGWSVFILWPVALMVGGRYLVPRHLYAFLTFALVMACLLIGICYKTGEPPRWRWGDDEG